MKRYRFLILLSLFFLQMCNAEDVYYLDEEAKDGCLKILENDLGISIIYLYDTNSGLLNLDDTGNEEYKKSFDGYYSLCFGISCPENYRIESFEISLIDIKTNSLIKEDFVIYGRDVPVEKYQSVAELIKIKKRHLNYDFHVLYKKEKMNNVKDALITIKYVFNRRGKLIQGEFKKEIYRKSRFKLG